MMINQRLFDHYGIDTTKDMGIKTNCPRPFDTLLIDKQGSCYACECQSWFPQSIGNLQVHSIDQILNSEIVTQLRSSILDGTYRYCNNKHCAWLLDRKNPPPWRTEVPTASIKNLRLAIDDSCNLRCPSCRTSLIYHKSGSRFELGIKLANIINTWLQTHQTPVRVHIGSDGDPFASHVYRHFMKNTPERPHINYSILTNALMLKEFHHHVPHIMRNLKELGVSIDGASKSTYERTRVGGKWEKIVENLEFVSRLKQTHRFDFLIHFVVQKNNYHEMPAIAELGRKYGADKVCLNRLTDWQTYEDFSAHDVVHHAHPEHKKFLKIFSDIKTNDNFLEYATL